MQEARNSFADSYRTHPPYQEDPANPEALDLYRLSEGKRCMLETFKKSMSSLEEEEQPKVEEERLDAMLKAYDMECFQIKEESNESEERSNKQLPSERNSQQHSSPQVEPKQQTSSLVPQGGLNTLMPLSTLGKERVSLAADIAKAIELLCRGVSVRKCCFDRFMIEECVLCFSEDFSLMVVHSKGQAKVYSLSSLVGVLKGAKSQNFKRYLSEEGVVSQLCFSIVLPDRSFDLLASTPQQRDNIVCEIQLLNECS